MEKITKALVMVVFMAGACTKDPVQQIPAPPHNPISKVETDSSLVETSYNGDGSIHILTRRQTNGTNITHYVFSYENGRLKEIDFGGKWKYNYTGNLISSVETYSESGVLRYIARYGYANDRVAEKTESLVSTAGEHPSFKTLYAYNADGNLSRKEVFYYINGAFAKNEEILFVKYDHNINTKEHLETYPYMPLTYFSVNNSLREKYLDENGQSVGSAVHEYAYDITGRPVSRKTTCSFIGFPDTYSVSAFHY